MKFGIFDHMDDNGGSVAQLYRDRLTLIEAYERAGIYAYHLAEHHGTPLGFAPSPSVFLAAAAQRTTTLRLGALVYLLPFYHPIRIAEEIAMLDNLSDGRLEMGVGRGVSPIEAGFYGLDHGTTMARYQEELQIVRSMFATDELTFDGTYHHFDKVPVVLKPVQQPHPPLWCGVGNPEAAEWAAENDVNIVAIATPEKTQTIATRYRDVWQRRGKPESALPRIGVSRHVVVADTDAQAKAIADRAYRVWRSSFFALADRFGYAINLGKIYPEDWAGLEACGNAFAGSPESVRAYLTVQAATGINYFVAWLAFGDLTVRESLHSLDLYAQHVMPAFRDQPQHAVAGAS
jgi:alkanesulfonate monooxygenase SsuD/methylene tetrahydromethanopterin reductase-like flavin-dependent oxidoreductase (luciferase family)